ncbi:shieldin complex subunit 1 isoform X6 [Delphinus delphis]|uniref:shieldin complex subunit 1 isoform X6 n=1 Tax=Delphinus delphis TaxID=9728 RepID=UPI0028C3B0F0|nr:shieldin complex subunit 1 isoform X7 [Delphinus delphis]
MSTTACDWVSSNERCLARTMANQEATPGSQSEESNALDLPSAYDIRDYVLQRPSQEANSEAFSSEEAFSIPCSSDTDPGSGRAGSVAMAHGPSCFAACGIFPDQGTNSCPLHRQADPQPLRHQGSP